MANPIRNFRCDDDTWNKFQDYCQSKNTNPSTMLLVLINSCLETSQEPIKQLDINQDDPINSAISQILDLVYDCKTKIEEQNYQISQLTNNVHDLEMKSKSNETNISILVENDKQLENSNLNIEKKTNEILKDLDSFDQECYQFLEEIVFYLDEIRLSKLTKSQLIGLLKKKKIEYSDSFAKDKLIKLCQENGISANEYQDKIKLPTISKNFPE